MSDYFYDVIKVKRDILQSMDPENKMDFLFICLDSCRYDVFRDADAPNMKSIGKLRRAHSFACFTPSSFVGFLMNFPPIGLNVSRLYPYKKWAWLPREFHRDGYRNAIFSSNVVVPLLDLNLDGAFLKEFDEKQFIKYEGESAVEEIVDDAIHFYASNDKTFIVLLLMETHTPIYDGVKAKIPYPVQRPDSVYSFQRRAVEFIDGKLSRLFDAVKESGRKTDVIITSDHGELLGPARWGHNPGDLTFYNRSRITFSEKLFEVPFIRGKIN